ncbi:methyltransferase domain-containing protein [Kocuria coralli]|uniref:Methyltransferase domain-containing protein n=1 Tax=Kocuria coralli TaxID=1461025 RepID=A0A5J5L138_9MICC|nr:methyltransferase domain-containing protein [Kocuria coralli]KAA9395563.1 methyltransferase domain-containing protein [Kocuria coralli]
MRRGRTAQTTPDEGQLRINDYWSRWAGQYEAHQADRRRAEGEDEIWGKVWGPALPDPPARVLDVGTGTGAAAFRVAALGHQVLGIDLAEGMLEQARRKAGTHGNPRFAKGDAAEPPFGDGMFDALTARYVLWTLRDPQIALEHWLRVLRRGGVLVAVDSLWFPTGLDGHGADGRLSAREADFRRAYRGQREALPLAEAASISAFAERIEAAGFADVTVEELPGLLEQDLRYGVAPGHRAQMQYLIRAVRPLS